MGSQIEQITLIALILGVEYTVEARINDSTTENTEHTALFLEAGQILFNAEHAKSAEKRFRTIIFTAEHTELSLEAGQMLFNAKNAKSAEFLRRDRR